MRALLVGIAVLALSGCTSLEEREAGTCQRAGYAWGTAGFERCMMRVDAAEQRQRAMWGGVAVGGLNMMTPAYVAPQPWSGSCTAWGSSMSCSGVR